MVGLKRLTRAFAAPIRACSRMLLSAGLALARFATNIEKFAASK